MRLTGAARTRDERLGELRALEATGDLLIRISYAGNLNVLARESDVLREEVGHDEGVVGYIRVMRRLVLKR